MGLKRTLMERGMRLMSDPRVMKLLSNPKVMNLVMKAFQLRGRVQSQIDAQIKTLAKMLRLATRDELNELKRTIRVLEEELRRLESESERNDHAKTARA
jgi:hypothetical protein